MGVMDYCGVDNWSHGLYSGTDNWSHGLLWGR